MPSGQLHSGTSIGIAAGIAIGYAAGNVLDPQQLPVMAAGSLFGVIMTPDLDSDNGSIDQWYIRKFGCNILAHLWGFWTAPYALAFKHRSFWSHAPIVSTVFRLLYLFFPLYVVILKDQKTSWLSLTFRALISQLMALPMVGLLAYFHVYPESVYWLYPFIIGLCISDFVHSFMDHIF